MREKIYVTKSSMPDFEEYIEEIRPIFENRWLTNMGEQHRKLENLLSSYLGVENISLFVNGHMALEMAIQAMELSGEVITTPFTFASTTHAIVRNGLTPVFCDIDPVNCTMDSSKIEQLITDRTTAILPVHVYGNVCAIEEIECVAKKHSLKVIYDAAHAFGVRYKGKGIGSFGNAAMFSFHATKVFNTIEGGAVCFHDSSYGEKLYGLKNFGIYSEDEINSIGANAKMNEFQASMGICNLRHIDREIERRKAISMYYRERLRKVDGIHIIPEQDNVQSNYAYFPIFIKEEYGRTREELILLLQENDIYPRKYFYPLTSQFHCYKNKFSKQETPAAAYAARHVLTLPLYADLALEKAEKICNIIENMPR